MRGFQMKLLASNLCLFGLGFIFPGFEGFAQTMWWPLIIAAYFGLTLLLVNWLKRSSKKSAMQFVTAVNGATAIKMFFSLALVLIYLVALGGEHRIPFTLGLFLVFVVNTVWMVIESQNLSSDAKK